MSRDVKRKRGRPSEYTPERAFEICQRIADGKSLRTISAEEGMPDEATICRWLDRNEEFRNQYARARNQRVEKMAEEILSISDDPDEDPQSRRVRVDARKWLMSKWAPKKYGDKLEVEQHGEQLIQIRIGGDRPTEFINVDCRPVPALGNVIETDATVESETPLSE
jgi:hypothetical protein